MLRPIKIPVLVSIVLLLSACDQDSDDNSSKKKVETIGSAMGVSEQTDYEYDETVSNETSRDWISDGYDHELKILPIGTRKNNHKNFMTIAEAAYRVREKHPLILAAQWAIESSWGKNQAGKHNYFGIKAVGKEKGTIVRTHEVIKGKRIAINDKFKDYPTLMAGIADRVDFVRRNPRYGKAGYYLAKNTAEAAQALQRAGYATDPHYAAALINLIGYVRHNGRRLDPHKAYNYRHLFSLSSESSATAGSACEARELC